MKWHPDKNKSEEAKHKFQEVSEAYSVLSTPSEKTWYDRHRETIIKNWNASTGAPTTAEGGNTLTNGGSYWPYFVRPGFLGYDDSESGFYTVYRNVFNAIKEGVEEMNSFVAELENSEEMEFDTHMAVVRAPSFGDSETKLFKVAHFYYYWEHLIPFIETAWAQLYDLDLIRNPDVSFEDRSWRENLVKKFIEMIQNIVQYVKHKDPRYHRYLENKTMIDLEGEENNEGNVEAFPDSKEIALFNDYLHSENMCLECWAWASSHLRSLMQLDTKSINWADMLFGNIKQIHGNADSNLPAIGPADEASKEHKSNDNQGKLIDEFPNNTYCNEDQDIL